MAPRPRIAIVILSYYSEPYLPGLIKSWQALDYPVESLVIVVVDNPHPTHGSSLSSLKSQLLPLSQRGLPEIVLLPQASNLGFAGGCNVGIRYALDNTFDYVLLHNQDGTLRPSAVTELVNCLEQNPSAATAQALVVMQHNPVLINSAGNSVQYLGFGFCKQLNESVSSIPTVFSDITYGSGAALLLRSSLLKKYGLLDEDFFAYHEDLEYCLRLRLLGFSCKLAPRAVFEHRYEFVRNERKLYLMERNRFATLLLFYKWPTLLLIAPAALVMELGLIIFSLRQGWLKVKLASYGYWLVPSHWPLWLRKRRLVQRGRIIADRQLIKDFTAPIIFNDPAVANPLLEYVANPFLTAYWWLVRRLIIW